MSKTSNPCEVGTVPRQIKYGDKIFIASGQKKWDPMQWLYIASKSKVFPVPITTEHLSAGSNDPTEFTIRDKNASEESDGKTLRSGDIIILHYGNKDFTSSEKLANPEANFNENAITFSVDTNANRTISQWIVKKVAGFSPAGNADDIHYGDTFTLTSKHYKDEGCTQCYDMFGGKICQSELICSNTILDEEECRWLCKSGTCDTEKISKKSDAYFGTYFRFYNTEKGITCDQYQPDVCREKGCPAALCPDKKLVCPITGDPVQCDPDTKTYFCNCSEEGSCPSGYICDSDSNRCIPNPNVRCTQDSQCASVDKHCGSEGICVDCTQDSHCVKGESCRNEECVDASSGGSDGGSAFLILALFLAVLGVLLYIYLRWRKHKRQSNETSNDTANNTTTTTTTATTVDLGDALSDLSLHNNYTLPMLNSNNTYNHYNLLYTTSSLSSLPLLPITDYPRVNFH